MSANLSSLSSITLGFLGGGNMAEAMVRGILDRKLLPQSRIVLTDVSPERRSYLRDQFSAPVLADAKEVLRDADVVLFAVKPQNMPDLLASLSKSARPEQVFLSICAGIRTGAIEEGLRHDGAPNPRVIRIMPNTPALIGKGVAGIAGGKNATEEDLQLADQIFSAIGTTNRVEESMMDAVTALTGSGPAYVFYLLESLIAAGIEVGFPPEQSRRMVLDMVLGSAALAAQSEHSPEELRRMVTSPGGTTAAGVAVLDEAKVRDIFIACVKAAEARGRELSKA